MLATDSLPHIGRIAERHPGLRLTIDRVGGRGGNMHEYLRQIYDAFGPARMFWGTDITKMPCAWRQCVTMFTEALSWLPARDKPLVMGQAVCAWWRWKKPSTTMEDRR